MVLKLVCWSVDADLLCACAGVWAFDGGQFGGGVGDDLSLQYRLQW